MTMRREIEEVLQKLLAQPGPQLSLDAVGEALGTLAVTVDEVDHLMRTLEQHGRVVDEGATASPSTHLAVTLTSARRLRISLNRPPTPDEIAADAGISVTSVRSALLFARILQR